MSTTNQITKRPNQAPAQFMRIANESDLFKKVARCGITTAAASGMSVSWFVLIPSAWLKAAVFQSRSLSVPSTII